MTETFHIVQVDASPNQCRLTDELVLTLTVETEASLLINACVTLILDVAYTKKEIHQERIESNIQIPSGTSEIVLRFPALVTIPAEDRIINNVAAYRLDFSKPGDQGIFHTLNLVSAIDKRDGEYYRTIFSPFQ